MAQGSQVRKIFKNHEENIIKIDLIWIIPGMKGCCIDRKFQNMK